MRAGGSLRLVYLLRSARDLVVLLPLLMPELVFIVVALLVGAIGQCYFVVS